MVPRLNFASVEALLAEAAQSGYVQHAVDTLAASIAAGLPQALPWVAPLLSPETAAPTPPQGEAPLVEAMQRHATQRAKGLGGVAEMAREGDASAVLERAAAAAAVGAGSAQTAMESQSPHVATEASAGGDVVGDDSPAMPAEDRVPTGKTGGVEVVGQTTVQGMQTGKGLCHAMSNST